MTQTRNRPSAAPAVEPAAPAVAEAPEPEIATVAPAPEPPSVLAEAATLLGPAAGLEDGSGWASADPDPEVDAAIAPRGAPPAPPAPPALVPPPLPPQGAPEVDTGLARGLSALAEGATAAADAARGPLFDALAAFDGALGGVDASPPAPMAAPVLERTVEPPQALAAAPAALEAAEPSSWEAAAVTGPALPLDGLDAGLAWLDEAAVGAAAAITEDTFAADPLPPTPRPPILTGGGPPSLEVDDGAERAEPESDAVNQAGSAAVRATATPGVAGEAAAQSRGAATEAELAEHAATARDETARGSAHGREAGERSAARASADLERAADQATGNIPSDETAEAPVGRSDAEEEVDTAAPEAEAAGEPAKAEAAPASEPALPGAQEREGLAHDPLEHPTRAQEEPVPADPAGLDPARPETLDRPVAGDAAPVVEPAAPETTVAPVEPPAATVAPETTVAPVEQPATAAPETTVAPVEPRAATVAAETAPAATEAAETPVAPVTIEAPTATEPIAAGATEAPHTTVAPPALEPPGAETAPELAAALDPLDRPAAAPPVTDPLDQVEAPSGDETSGVATPPGPAGPASGAPPLAPAPRSLEPTGSVAVAPTFAGPTADGGPIGGLLPTELQLSPALTAEPPTSFEHPVAAVFPAARDAADTVLGQATARSEGATTAAVDQVEQAAAVAAPAIDAEAARAEAQAEQLAQERAAAIAARREAESAGVIAGADHALADLSTSDAAWREQLAAHTAAAHARVDAEAQAERSQLSSVRVAHADRLEATAETHRARAQADGVGSTAAVTARGARQRAEVATSREALTAELEASVAEQTAALDTSLTTSLEGVRADFEQRRLTLRTDASIHHLDVDAGLTEVLTRIDATVDARVEAVHTSADTERTLLAETRRDEQDALDHSYDLQIEAVRAEADTRADEVLDLGVASSTRIVEQGNEDAAAAIAAANARADQYPVRPGPAGAEQNARNRELARAARAAGQRQASMIRGTARSRGAAVSRQALTDAADLRAQGEAEADGLTARLHDLTAGLTARHDQALAALDARADAGVTALEQERLTTSDAARAEAELGADAIDAALDTALAELDLAEQAAVTAIQDATDAAREELERRADEGRALLEASESTSLAELDAQIDAVCADIADQVDTARTAIDTASAEARADADAAVAKAEAEIEAATTAARDRVEAADAGLAEVLDEIVTFTTEGVEQARAEGLTSLAEWGDYARSELVAEAVLRIEAIGALATERRAALRDARETALDEIGVLAEAFPAGLEQAVTEAGQVFDAVAAIHDGTENVVLADGDSERDAATVAAAATLAEQLAGLPPELRAQVMAEVDDDVRVLVDELGSLTGDQTRDALASFTRAGEALGAEHVALLTDVVAEGLQDQVDGHHDNPGEIEDGIRAAIANGNGALFASALAESLHDKGQVVLAGQVAGFAEAGVGDVMEDYRDALGEFEEYEAFLANWTLQNGPIVGSDAVAAAEQAFRDEHREVYEAFLAQQQRYLTVLDGAAYAVDTWADNEGMVVGTEPTQLEPYTSYREVDDDDSAMFDAMYHVTTLQSGLERDAASGQWVASSVGQDALTDAMLREGAGERTFLTTAAEQGERFDARAHDEAGLDDDQALSVGWTDRMAQTLDLTLVSAAQNALLRDLDGDGLGDLDVDTLTDSLEAWGRVHATLGSDELDYEVFAREAAREILEVRDQVAAGALEYADLISTTRAAFAAGTSDPISAARAGYPDELSPTLSASLAAIGDTIGIVQGVAAWGDTSLVGKVQTGMQPLVLAQRLLDAKSARTLADTGVPSGLGTVANGIGLTSSVVDFAAGLDSLLRDDATMSEAFATAMGGSSALGALAELNGMARTARLFGKASTVLAVGLSVFEAGAAALAHDWDGAALAALPAIGAGVGALFGGIGAPVGLAIGTLAQFALGSLLSRDPNKDYEAATQIAWSAAITSLVPGASSLDVERLSHELRNVDDDWVGAGPVLALVAREAGMSPESLFAGLLDLAHRADGEQILSQLVAHNLLDADITNWDEVVEASQAVLTDPTVEIPSLEYDRAQIRDLATWLSEGLESDGDSFFRYSPYTYVDAQDVSGQVADAYNEWIHWMTEHPDEPVPETLEDAVNAAPSSGFSSSGSFEHAEFPVSSDERVAFDAGLPQVASPDPGVAADQLPPAPAPEPAFEAVPTEVLSAIESQVEAMGYRRGTAEFDAMVWGIASAGVFG